MKSYYNSDEWTALRAAALERDAFICQVCGVVGQAITHDREYWGPTDGIKLIAHHIIDRKDGGLDVLENLLTVCASCHTKFRKNRHASH